MQARSNDNASNTKLTRTVWFLGIFSEGRSDRERISRDGRWTCQLSNLYTIFGVNIVGVVVTHGGKS